MLSWNMKVWKMCQVVVNKNDDNKATYFFILRYFSTFNVSERINFPVQLTQYNVWGIFVDFVCSFHVRNIEKY